MAKKNSFFAQLSRPVDLTEGTPWKVILKYSAPIIISYFLQQIYVLTDAIICGQVLTSSEVAGVNDTFPLTFIFLQFAFGCTAGFSVVTARFVGQNDARGVRKSFAAQIYLSVAISLLLTVVSIALLPQLLGIINVTETNKAVYDAAYSYCFVIFIGIIAQMGYNFVCGILRAYGDSVTPLVFLIISTALNVVLDIVFLSTFKMGPSGAAIATVLAQFISVIACSAYTFIKYKELRLHISDFKVDKTTFFMHLKQGIPLGLQFSVLAIGIIVMQAAVVEFDIMSTGEMVLGTPAQNGFGAANKLINFLMAAYNGLGSAILGFNAQNYGRQNYDRIKKGTVQTVLIMLIVFVICLVSGLLLSINGAYQYIFMSADKVSAETIRFGNIFIYVDIAFYAVLGFLIVVRSAVQGIFLPGYVLGAGIAELTARVLICSCLPRIINGAPINDTASSLAFAAVCFGDPGAWLCALTLLLLPFIKYILKKKYRQL
ncbi:MAG: hypothetical protein EGQ30_08070 [Clostridiales bacterium]|nr:hypothetical protein [Clostridiales bacterium]